MDRAQINPATDPETAPIVARFRQVTVWDLHAAIFYLSVREFISNLPVEDTNGVVDMELGFFFPASTRCLERGEQ
ncbi:hypothetical protein GA0061102_10023 [Rhizobium miluonense]|uniref:Uncharacterized protein n=1 Tax=Rhizobium miluonense TaxID=411945 RepID=A0A1C3U5M4_9HYPH|nr:hypothetical protein GA0061102_10023 [Rhizobium miluonense]